MIFLDAEHDGYARLEPGVIHQRPGAVLTRWDRGGLSEISFAARGRHRLEWALAFSTSHVQIKVTDRRIWASSKTSFG